MTKKERVQSVIRGETPDRTPAGFWYHFPSDDHNGSAAVNAHLNYLRDTDVDMLKIMNENLYRVDSPPRTAAEWRALQPAPVTAAFYQNQLEVVRNVLDAVDDSIYTLITIHGVFASAFHLLGLPDERFQQKNPVEHLLADDPEALAEGFRTISESLAGFARECANSGVDGIYYAALGGERWRAFPKSTFEQAIKPADHLVLDQLADSGADLFVHICKPDVDFSPYADYPGDVFNWAVHANDLSLRDGYNLFQRPILGGFDDRSGILVEGTEAQIAAEARRLAAAHSDIPFMLGADCTLPSNLKSSRIRSAVHALRQ